MIVLFLGGPWHDQRHDVPLVVSRFDDGGALPARYTVHVAMDDEGGASNPRRRRQVTYVRRFVRGPGGRLPVYVAPDYAGPARA